MSEDTEGENFLIDASLDREKFTMIPNMLDDIALSVYAFRLYAHIKRVVGEDKTGRCWQSTRTLAKSCCMSVGAVVKAKRELEWWGLIYIKRIPGRHGEFAHDEITVKNIWKHNIEWFERPKYEREEIVEMFKEKFKNEPLD